jgi:hypothetical protein
MVRGKACASQGCWCLTVCLTPYRPRWGRIPGGSESSAASDQRPPRPTTPSKRRSLVTAGNSLEKRIAREGDQHTAGGSTSRYRTGQSPLPGGPTRVETPFYPAGRGRPHTRQHRRPLPASNYHLPSAQRSTTPSAITAHGTASTAAQTPSCQVISWCMNVS